MMHNHGGGKVVNLFEQLTELSKTQLIPEIRPQIKMSSIGSVLNAELEQNGEKGERGLNHFPP